MRNRIFLFAAALVAAACTTNEPSGPAPSFVYHPQGRMVPFPSDRYLEKAAGTPSPDEEGRTGYRIATGGYAEADPALYRFPGVAEGLADLDGFGTSADIAVGLTAGADVSALADEATGWQLSTSGESPIWLISIAEGDPQAGVPLPFVARLETDGNVLFLRPFLPLQARGWYAVVFRPSLRDVTGRAYAAPAGFLADYNGQGGEGLEGEGYARLKSVIDFKPVFALTFRTGSIREKLGSLVDEVRAAAPGAITFTTRDPGAEYPNMATIVEGWFTHRNYRGENGKLSGEPLGEEKLRFTLTLPKATAEHQEPFRLALGQHGLNDKRQAIFRFADAFAADGVAVVGIDAPSHGSRGPGEGGSYDALRGARENLGVWTDGENLTFRSWQFRDIIRQQTLDHLQIIKAVEAWAPDVARASNAPGVDVDAAHPVYTGQSMGGIIGGVSGAMNTEFERVLLNVPGGRISNILVRNEVLGNMLVALMRPRTITMSDAYRMIGFVQTALDPGDPINYVGGVARTPFDGKPRPVLIQAALHDATVPNFTTYDLARAADAPLAGPFVQAVPGLGKTDLGRAPLVSPDARAFAFFRDIIDHDGDEAVADHGNLWHSRTAVRQALIFLKQGRIEEP